MAVGCDNPTLGSDLLNQMQCGGNDNKDIMVNLTIKSSSHAFSLQALKYGYDDLDFLLCAWYQLHNT